MLECKVNFYYVRACSNKKLGTIYFIKAGIIAEKYGVVFPLNSVEAL